MKPCSSLFSLWQLGAAVTIGVGAQVATAKRPDSLFNFSDDHAPGRLFQHGSKVHVHFTCIVLAALAHVSFMSGAELFHRAGLLQVRKETHVRQG